MTKNLIIVALIIVIIYFYYQQNQPNINSNNSQIEQLQQQIKHYQSLYERKIKQVLGLASNDQASQTIIDYEVIIEEQKEKHNQQLRKINSLFLLTKNWLILTNSILYCKN